MDNNIKIAEYKYVYDPNHTNKPSGNWNRTNSGWSSNNVEYNHEPVKPYKPVNPSENTKETKTDSKQEEIDLFDEQESEFETDKTVPEQEEPIELEEESTDDEQEVNLDEQEDVSLDDEQEVNLDEQEDVSLDDEQEVNLDEESSEESFFTDTQKESMLNADNFDSYIEKMNSFIEVFDEDEGKENKVTFKAVASNLDWSIEDDAKAFANHCKKQGLKDAEEIIAFLYYQYNNNKEQWETILEKMN